MIKILFILTAIVLVIAILMFISFIILPAIKTGKNL